MKQVIESKNAPKAIGPYSQAIQVGNTIYLSGQIPLDPVSQTLVSQEIKMQAEQVFKNLQAVAKAAGGDIANIVKLTIYLTDFNHFSQVNEVMTSFFSEPYPARATIQVSRLPKDAQIEVDAIMAI